MNVNSALHLWGWMFWSVTHNHLRLQQTAKIVLIHLKARKIIKQRKFINNSRRYNTRVSARLLLPKCRLKGGDPPLFELSIEYVVDGDERKRPRKARGREHLEALNSRSKIEDAIEKCFLRTDVRFGTTGIGSLCFDTSDCAPDEYRWKWVWI